MVSRFLLDHLRSAQVRRGLREPLVVSADHDPASKAEMADSLLLAFLVLLEDLWGALDDALATKEDNP